MTDSDVRVFQGSTATLRGREAVDNFREHFGRMILGLEMMPIADQPLECDVSIRAWEDVAFATGTLSPMSNHHPVTLGDDGLVLAILRRGEAELEHARGVAIVRGGTAVLTANEEAATFRGFTPTELCNIRLKHELLTLYMADPYAPVGQPIAADNAALRLLLSYAEVFREPRVEADAEMRRFVTEHVYDLAVLAFGHARDARAHAGGVRAARLHAIRADILRNIADPALSIGAVARRQGISASYVRRLLAANGTSFADTVAEHRLAALHRLLSDPRLTHRTISSLAYEVGFGDLSYFNRSFRRRYGTTPSEVRAAARDQGPLRSKAAR